MKERHSRAATSQDHAAVVAIIEAEDVAYRGQTDFTLEILRDQILADSGVDAERDLVVIEHGGAIVAYGLFDGTTAFTGVHPAHEDPQLRSDLIGWAEGRQSELKRTAYRVGCDAVNPCAVAAYRNAGYGLERVYAQMVRTFAVTGPPAPAVLDPDYRLRLVNRDTDAGVLHTLHERSFREQADHEPQSREDYTRAHLTFSQFEPAWSVIIETLAGQPAGSLVGWRPLDHPHGYVALLAVDPDHRRRGLGRAMLLTVCAAIHAAGLPAAELHVASDNPRALDLYTGVGMHEEELINHYIRTP